MDNRLFDLDDDSLVEKAKNWPSMEGLELASRVTCKEAYDFSISEVDQIPGEHIAKSGPRVAVYDFGVKKNILL